jgi:Fic-DOC domain mobile mystery protein B
MIGVELRQLLDDVQYWIANSTYEPDEIGARFHHRLVAIHLFPNGNGRHARLMTDILITELLGKESFTWGNGDLNHTGDARKKYLDALHSADKQDYRLLNDFIRS